MSAIFLYLGPLDRRAADRSLDAMRARGTEVRAIRCSPGEVMAAGAYGWQSDGELRRNVYATDQGLLVAADAALYYRADLIRKLQGQSIEAASDSAADLILAAYRAWGEKCTDHLEGDYAFFVRDQARRRVFAACDFVGTRPLYYGRIAGHIAIASTLGGLEALPGFRRELNLAAIAEMASMSLMPPHETVYSGAHVLPAGHSLVWEEGATHPRVWRNWRAPVFTADAQPSIPFDEAAHRLDELLQAAVRERAPVRGDLAITVSGGWDSPAVYAAAHGLIETDRIRPISISYPAGDSGREDELITRITGRYAQTPHWIDIRDIRVFGDESLATTCDEPLVHPFGEWNRALASAAAAAGTRICFNGMGGDHLFHSELIYLADLLRGGRITEFVREYARDELRAQNGLSRWIVKPLLARYIPKVAASLSKGVPLPTFPDWTVPPWIDASFANKAGLDQRIRDAAPQRDPEDSEESYVRRWMLEHSFYGRIVASVSGLSMGEQVEARSPLMDGRIVQFAASRPRRERRSSLSTKQLLRAAVADRLPADVLAPRPTRTGTTTSYLRRAMMTEFGPIAEPLLRKPVLADLGIVNQRKLYAAAAAAERGLSDAALGAVVATFRTELWLRAHLGMTPVEITKTSADAARSVAVMA